MRSFLVALGFAAACAHAPADTRRAVFAGARVEGSMDLAAVWGAGPGAPGAAGGVIDVVASSDGQWAVVGGARLELVAVATGEVRAVLADVPVIGARGQMAFSADGQRFAAVDGQGRGCIAVWVLAAGAARRERCVPVPDSAGLRLALSPDGGAAVTWDHRGRVERRDLTSGVVRWRARVPVSEGARLVLSWPTADVVLIGSSMALAARGAAGGEELWEAEIDVDQVLRGDGDGVVVMGDSGVARLSLADGEATVLDPKRAAWGVFDGADYAAAVAGGVVAVDVGGKARRLDRNGREVARFQVTGDIDAIAGAGTTLLVAAGGELSRWDVSNGRRRDLPGAAIGAVIAVAAGSGRVIAGTADAALVIWPRRGEAAARLHALALRCGRWTFSPARRWAVCTGADAEWFALDRAGTRGRDRGTLRVTPGQPTFWLDEDTLATPDVLSERRPATGYVGALGAPPPRFAAAIDGDEVAMAGLSTRDPWGRGQRPRPLSPPVMSMPPPGRRYWEDPIPTGLAVWRHDGAKVVLDGEVDVSALAAGPDTIALDTGAELHLWRRSGANAPWRRLWNQPPPEPPPSPAGAWGGSLDDVEPTPRLLALSADARWLAVADSDGAGVYVRDARTGGPVGSIDLAATGTRATALGFAGDHLFVGTGNGRVLELRPR